MGSERPFRWPVTVGRSMGATPGRVWEVISAPGYLAHTHPFCAANPVEKWPGPDAHDVIEYHNGLVVHRRFTAWLEGVGYDLEASDQRGTTPVSWRVEPDGAGARLTISLGLYLVQHLPLWVRWAPHLFVVRPGFRSYLDSVLRGIDYFATTGQPVVKNQFGPHRWFSPE